MMHRHACWVFVWLAGLAVESHEAFAYQAAAAQEVRQLGLKSFSAGKYFEAERQLRTALDGFMIAGDPLNIASTLRDLAGVRQVQGGFAESEQLLVRALGVMTQVGGSHPREKARILANLGSVYGQLGQRKLAAAAFEDALRLLQKELPDDPQIAVIFSNIAVVHIEAEDFKSARTALQNALRHADRTLPGEHADRVAILTNLAALAQREKKWSVAESYLARATKIAEVSLPSDHPELGLVLEHLGVVHYRQKKLVQAEVELRRALEIGQTALGPGSFRTVSVTLSLAKVLAAGHRYTDAAPLFGAALAGQERLFGPATAEVATTLELYAKLLHELKNDAPAADMQARAKRIRAELSYTIKVGDAEK